MAEVNRDILRFPDWQRGASHTSPDGDEAPDDSESWEVHSELLDRKDYPALVQYCEREVARKPGDLYAHGRLGEAYILNGQYQKAIDSMRERHREYPDVEDFKYIILDALFALGKTEDDFPWVEAPTIIRLGSAVIDDCYEYLRPKRKPRSVDELHTRLLMRGYVAFTHEQLMQALADDQRFIVQSEGDCHFAEVGIRRTRRRNRRG
ncbi:MAG TPA: hypothetical protein VMY37_27565 [Thermoguttaceae bacterium]|nr:hypothetical protein [Thermoguttaceae bacterium]